MAIVPQKQLFSWKEIENLGDLSRLRLVLDYLPDEPLLDVIRMPTLVKRHMQVFVKMAQCGRKLSSGLAISCI